MNDCCSQIIKRKISLCSKFQKLATNSLFLSSLSFCNKNYRIFYLLYYRIQESMKPTHSFSKYHPGVNPTHPGFKTRPPHDVFPQDIECVYQDPTTRSSIFVGNLQAAQNIDTLKKHRIKSILTACKNIHIKHPKEHVPFALYIPGEDHQNYDLSMHFDTAINFIHESLKETNILVHCMAGVSRSVTLVLAYLIKHKGMNYNEAYKHVLRNRNKINPNPGFIRQLQRWQQKHSALDRSRTRYSAEHIDITPKSKYDNVYKAKVYSYKDIENAENKSRYQPLKYASKYGNLSHLQNSQTRIYNPEYESTFSKANTSFNSTLKPTYEPIQRNNSNDRLKEMLNIMNTTQKSYHNPSPNPNRERSIENLSRDLDSRIAKIKQKYYETSNTSFESRKMNMTDYDQRWGVSHIQERKVSNFEGLDRSRASRQSLRSSIYTPYNATRTMTYQYS